MDGSINFVGSLSGSIDEGGGGGGSTVTITPTYNSGTKLADFTIGETSGAIFVDLSDYLTESEIASLYATKSEVTAVDIGLTQYVDGNFQRLSDAIRVVEISESDYNELSSDLKNNPYIIYFVSGVERTLDPSYTYHTNSDNTIIVREKDNDIKWFFNGVSVSGTSTAIPSDLQQYAPSSASCIAYIDANNTPSTQSNPHDWLGIYQNTVRCWYYSYGGNVSGTFYGMLDKNDGNSQNTQYSDPYVYIETQTNYIMYKNKRY